MNADSPDCGQRPRTLLAFITFNVFCVSSAAVAATSATAAYSLYVGLPEGVGVLEALRTESFSSTEARLVLIPALVFGAILGGYLWAVAMRASRLVPAETIRRFVGGM